MITFIRSRKTSGVRTYTNIDAYIFGGDITSVFDLGYGLGVGGGIAYQRGRKFDQPENNNDKDLAEIAPLKVKLSLDYDNNGLFCNL